jgi:hypothetical protein
MKSLTVLEDGTTQAVIVPFKKNEDADVVDYNFKINTLSADELNHVFSLLANGTSSYDIGKHVFVIAVCEYPDDFDAPKNASFKFAFLRWLGEHIVVENFAGAIGELKKK